MLGIKQVGGGKTHVVVMHDWFSDTTSYDTVLKYFDLERFTFTLVDLRGYGRSKQLSGSFTVQEAAQDVLSVTKSLGIERYFVVGHSMSGMIAQYMLLEAAPAIDGVVAITPVPACGNPAPAEQVQFMQDAATLGHPAAYHAVDFMSGNRLCPKFLSDKAAHWHACSTEEARLAYMKMFTTTDFSDRVLGLATPMLVVCGQYDSPACQISALKPQFEAWYPNVQLVLCENSGHYPMLETPVFLASQMTRFFEAT